MATLRNHPDKWLRDDAAASLNRFEARYGVISVNSAGRTVDEQRALIARWDKGGPYNRPPYLYSPQRPAERSNHVQNGGVATDTSHIDYMLKYGRDYGWIRPFAGDPVHFEYHPELDKYRFTNPAGGKPVPIAPPTIEDDMLGVTVVNVDTKTQFAITRESLHGFKREADANKYRQVTSVTDELHRMNTKEIEQFLTANGIPAAYAYDDIFFKERGDARSDKDPEAWRKSNHADWSLTTEINDRLKRLAK